MDPLSQVLSLLKPHSYKCGGMDIGGSLSVRFSKHEGIKCYAVVHGQGWLSIEGIPDPVRLETGDCFLLPRGEPFRLGSDLTSTPIDAMTLLANKKNGGIGKINGGGDCMIVGGHFVFSGNAEFLLSALPPIVHLQKESDKAALRWSLDRMIEELRDPQPGSSLVAEHLAHMMLVQALRLYLAGGLKGSSGWLYALADPQMSTAIGSMHDDPARRWTVEELAARAGMSRSIFAAKFKETVGDSPMEYLTRWRMLLAEEKLASTSDSISGIARSLGYESQSAFTKAFKRTMGCAPRQRNRIPAPSTRESVGTIESRLEHAAG